MGYEPTYKKKLKNGQTDLKVKTEYSALNKAQSKTRKALIFLGVCAAILLVSFGISRYKQTQTKQMTTQEARQQSLVNYKSKFNKQNKDKKVDSSLAYQTPKTNLVTDDYGPQSGAPQTYKEKADSGKIPDYVTKMSVSGLNDKSLDLSKPTLIVYYQQNVVATQTQNKTLEELSKGTDGYTVKVINITEHPDASKDYADWLAKQGMTASVPPIDEINAIAINKNKLVDTIIKQNQANTFTVENIRNIFAEVNANA